MSGIGFNIKERNEQSEIINKATISCAEAGSFNISDGNGKKETNQLKIFRKSLRRKIVQRNVCCEALPNQNVNDDGNSHVCTRCKIDKGILKKFSAANNMDLDSVPPELGDFTLVCRNSNSKSISGHASIL